MNFTVQPEMKRKRDVYQYIRGVLPFGVATSDFLTCCSSKDLVNTKISSRQVKWPAVKVNAARRPEFLRLDSQGESSQNDWVTDSSWTDSFSSGNDRRVSLFSDIFQHYMGTCQNQLTTVCCKPKPVKPYCLSITEAVRPFCQQNNFLLVHRYCKPSVAQRGNIVPTVQALHCGPQVLLCCTGKDTVMQHVEHKNTYCQELQYGLNIAPLVVSSLNAVPQPCVVDLSDCESVFKQCQNENSNQLSVISVRSSDAVHDDCAAEIRWLRRHCRWPRFNCKRKLLRVCHTSRHRKPLATSCNFLSSRIVKCPTDDELLDSYDACHGHEFLENSSVSADARHSLLQILSPFHDLVTRVEDNAACVNNYCSQLSLPSSWSDIQETLIQECCSFASSLFVSGKEMDSSDCCCTDSDESDCSELPLSSVYSTGDVLPECLLTELPCFHVPFTDNWVLGFSDYTSASLDADFDMCFEEDSTYIPGDDEAVCSCSLGVEEANNRWNEAYSFAADVLSTSPQHHSRMV